MRSLMTGGMLLALAGCGGNEVANNSATPTPIATPGPMVGNVDLNKPVRVTGKGGTWSMDVAPGTIAFRGDRKAAPADFYPVSPKLGQGRAVFDTQTAEADPVTITMTGTECALGARRLPLTVEMRVGAREMRGCAQPIDYVGQP